MWRRLLDRFLNSRIVPGWILGLAVEVMLHPHPVRALLDLWPGDTDSHRIVSAAEPREEDESNTIDGDESTLDVHLPRAKEDQ